MTHPRAIEPTTPRLNPSNIMFLGDTHGETNWWKPVTRHARANNIDVIIQLGDFGYWEHEPSGIRYLDDINTYADANGVDVIAIRGNHDNPETVAAYTNTDEDGFTIIRPRIRYAPNAMRFTWSGIRFAVAGGAPSVDSAHRHIGIDWWPNETLSFKDSYTLIDDGPCDVLLCHDAPEGIDFRHTKHIPEADAHRRLIREIVEATSPKIVFHGHYHLRHTTTITLEGGDTCRVEGLAEENRFEKSWYLCGIDQLTR